MIAIVIVLFFMRLDSVVSKISYSLLYFFAAFSVFSRGQVDACVYDVQIDTNEDSIWVLFDIIQRNFLLLPIRDDLGDLAAFKAAHGLGGQTPAPQKKKRKHPWAVTDLGTRLVAVVIVFFFLSFSMMGGSFCFYFVFFFFAVLLFCLIPRFPYHEASVPNCERQWRARGWHA
jgi:hypothetical protein